MSLVDHSGPVAVKLVTSPKPTSALAAISINLAQERGLDPIAHADGMLLALLIMRRHPEYAAAILGQHVQIVGGGQPIGAGTWADIDRYVAAAPIAMVQP